MKTLLSILAVACLLVVPPVAAESAESAESAWELGVAAGYGQRSNPLVGGDAIKFYADVDIAWFGERWFFDNGDLGVTLADHDALTVNLIARVNSDRLFFSRSNGPIAVFDSGLDAPVPILSPPSATDDPIELEPPDRSWALEAGVELLAEGSWGFLQGSGMHDVSDVHNGYEFTLNYGYGFAVGRVYVEPSAGLTYKSRDINDYYWGIRGSETPSGVSGYSVGSGFNWMARMGMAYQLSERWALSAAIEYERLNGEASRSPIVRRNHVLGFFAGLGYRF